MQLNPGGFTLGGTLVAGPGCPAVCGSFVACALDRRSRNNLKLGDGLIATKKQGVGLVR